MSKNQYELGFTFVFFKGYQDQPILVKPEDIKYIKPQCPKGFIITLKDKANFTVYDSIEEIQEKLGQMSYKFIGEPNGQTKRKTNAKKKKTIGE